MNTGCIRCTVRGDLIAGLKKLIKNTDDIQEGKQLDGVMTETTCLAIPVPMAQTFFADFVQQHMRLDGILSLVDAAPLLQLLDDTAVEQIAFAARLLNKCDVGGRRASVGRGREVHPLYESKGAIKSTMHSEVKITSP